MLPRASKVIQLALEPRQVFARTASAENRLEEELISADKEKRIFRAEGRAAYGNLEWGVPGLAPGGRNKECRKEGEAKA